MSPAIELRPGTGKHFDFALALYLSTMRPYTEKLMVWDEAKQVASFTTPEGFDGGACDVLTSDKSQLAALRTELKQPDGATLLPETISKEPLGPVVRQGDAQWRNIVTWTLDALITAEELGVTAANADEMKTKSTSPDIKRLLGSEDKMGEILGLSNSWALDAVKAVGNYDEMYQRDITPLGLKRDGSVNALWNKGGLLYAPPIR